MFHYGTPAPHAESMVLLYTSTFAHCYDDEGGWEMSKVYTETYMESN
jgi:hypothetical protein